MSELPDWVESQAVPPQAMQDFCASVASDHDDVGHAFEVAKRLAMFGVKSQSSLAVVDMGRFELIAEAYDRLSSLSMPQIIMLKKIARRAVQEDDVAEQIASAERLARIGQVSQGGGAGSANQRNGMAEAGQSLSPSITLNPAFNLPESLLESLRVQSEVLQRVGKKQRAQKSTLGPRWRFR